MDDLFIFKCAALWASMLDRLMNSEICHTERAHIGLLFVVYLVIQH